MVRIIIHLIVHLIILNALCQAIDVPDSTIIIFSEPEHRPEYKGGHQQLIYFIASNIKYPESAIKDSIEGVVYVNFIVDTNGITKEHKILKGIRDDLNEEAIRIAKLIRFETPAVNQGRPIIYNYSLPIRFILKNRKNKIKQPLNDL
jgi:TonB family protein